MTKMFRVSIIHHRFIFIKSCSEKKITRVAFSGAGCQRTARGYGLGRWGYGLGRCQLGSNQLENVLEFLGVEMLKSLVLCCGGSIWHFWRRQMRLRQKDLVEISDLRVLCFWSVFCFLVQSFTPKSDTYIFSTSHWYILHTKDDIKTKNHGNQQRTVTEFECFFHNLPNKKAKCWVQKPRLANLWSFFFDIIFLTDFFPQLPEPPGSDSLVEHRAEATNSIHQAAENGDVPVLRHFLRVAPERVREKGSFGRWPQRMAELRLRWCCGWKVPEEIQHSQVWC